VLTANACALQGGTYRGNNVPCSASACAPGRPGGWFIDGDFNGDGVVTIADLAAFLQGYGAGDADINGDGATDVNDWMLFLKIYGQASAGSTAAAR
jgi:hypothetical protein